VAAEWSPLQAEGSPFQAEGLKAAIHRVDAPGAASTGPTWVAWIDTCGAASAAGARQHRNQFAIRFLKLLWRIFRDLALHYRGELHWCLHLCWPAFDIWRCRRILDFAVNLGLGTVLAGRHSLVSLSSLPGKNLVL